ncbi:hypothetical protein PT974_07283 [Cladobotryum mycophilum]|uniref:F-box domain-containing protein n=1 Tax=Cladobotryum mycophilum TaxID=491253 RepID=A0ABR0SQ46_9HYPO
MDPMDATPSATAMTVIPDHRSTPPLLTMPIEILTRISHHLNTTDFCNVRLTCRGLEQALFNDFADDFFSRKQFMISEFSLGALIDIAKSRLGWTMKHVNLSVDHITLATNAISFLGEEQQRYCHAYRAQQINLWSTGLVHDLLAEAFRHLPNLESVVIRDFNSYTRHRDGPKKAWKSYGAKIMRDTCGVEPVTNYETGHYMGYQVDYAGQLFTAVLKSLGTVDARPKSIKIYERRGNRLQDTAFYIPRAIEAKVLPVLNNLTELHLCIREIPSSIQHNSINYLYLRKFLAHCSNLEILRLNSHFDNYDMIERDCLKSLQLWLAAPPPRPAQHLKITLSFGFMSTTTDDLLAILTKFAPTLKRLELWKVILGAKDPQNDDRIARANICLWTRFFRKLLAIPGLDINEILLGFLRQYGSGVPSSLSTMPNIRFIKTTAFIEEDASIRVMDELKYRGEDIKDFISGITMMFNADWVTYEDWRQRSNGEILFELFTLCYQHHDIWDTKRIEANDEAVAALNDPEAQDGETELDIAASKREAEKYIHRVRVDEDALVPEQDESNLFGLGFF